MDFATVIAAFLLARVYDAVRSYPHESEAGVKNYNWPSACNHDFQINFE